MNCEDCQILLAEAVSAGRRPAADPELAEHLDGCAECRRESALFERLWQRLPDSDSAAPVSEFTSRRMVRSFEAALGDELQKTGRSLRSGASTRASVSGWLAAAASLVVGLALGFLLGERQRSGGEVEALRAELRAVSDTVGIALMSHPSASERLRGVALAARDVEADTSRDDRALTALVELLRDDPSDNVRLAVVEVLADRVTAPEVGEALTAALDEESSPQVQAAVLEALEGGSGELLERALSLSSLDPEVKSWFVESRRSGRSV